MNSKESKWQKLERGQALMEYWPTIPAAIAVMIMAGIVANWVNAAFLTTQNSLVRTGLPAEVCDTVEEEDTADDKTDDKSEMGDHVITLVGKNYDADTDTTTIVYRVKSGPKPSISHWVLGLPKEVADNVTFPKDGETGKWEDSDPTTKIAGIKFDEGYEVKEVTRMTDTTIRFGSARGTVLTSYTGDLREISMILSGSYTYEPVPVTIKAGGEVYSSTISAPVATATPEPEDPLDADNLFAGCD